MALARRVAEGVRDRVVRGNRFPAIFALNVAAYRLAERALPAIFGRIPGVRAMYLAHGLALGECFPGLTDFDLIIVFEAEDRRRFYDRMRRRWLAARLVLPVHDLRLISRAEFDLWQSVGGNDDPLDELVHWRHLHGTDLKRRTIDTASDQALLDRVAHGLRQFQNLMQVALKEERRAPNFAIFGRRQLYKSFWSSMVGMDRSYLSIPVMRHRVAEWQRNCGMPGVVPELEAMHARRFDGGSLTRLRVSASVQAYRTINERLAMLVRQEPPGRSSPWFEGHDQPVANAREVEGRLEAMTAGFVRALDAALVSIVLGSSGSVRGYACYVVLRDDLDDEALSQAFKDLRAVFRVFDTPWFNERFPRGLPTVYSRSMFLARLAVGRSTVRNLARYRRVLHGPDLVGECIAAAGDERAAPDSADYAREQLAYSLHLNYVYLRRLKPALYDFVTLHYPRLALQRDGARPPATAEEAVFELERRGEGAGADLARRYLERYGALDADALHRAIVEEHFEEAWPVLGRLLAGPPAKRP